MESSTQVVSEMDIDLSTNVVSNQAVLMNNVLFSGVGGQPVDDMIFFKNCIYIALHRADEAYDSHKKPEPWFDHFVGTLWSIGWTCEGDPVKQIEPAFTGSVLQHWRKSAGRLVTRTQFSQVEASLAALEKDVLLLQKFSGLSGKTFSSHILPISYNRQGQMVVVLSHIRFIQSVLSTDYLFWQVHQPTSQLDVRARKLVISRRVMNDQRAIVEQTLREIASRFEEYEL